MVLIQTQRGRSVMTTMKTIKLKRTPVEADTMQLAAQPGESAVPTPPALPAPLGLESAATAGHRVPAKSYLMFGLMAIAATLFCIAIIGLQAGEWSYFKADPSVWPLK